MRLTRFLSWRVLAAALTLVGFALRAHDLAGVTYRWDEGWSVAMATLPLRDLFRLTAEDVHPPLYYLGLRTWLPLIGPGEFGVRYLSLLVSALGVPLAAVAARAWANAETRPRGAARRSRGLIAGGGAGRSRGLIAGGGALRSRGLIAGVAVAALVAIAPALVYYAGVARMYALTAPGVLLAAWGLGRMLAPGAPAVASEPNPDPGPSPDAQRASNRPGRGLVSSGAPVLGAVMGALVALHTFYYTGFALAGLFAGALVTATRRRSVAAILVAAAATTILYLPWLAYAAPLMSGRFGVGSGSQGGLEWAPLAGLMREGLIATVFAYRARGAALAVPALVLAAGLAVDLRWLAGRILPFALAVVATVVAAAVGTQTYMFAPRYLIPATPLLAIALGLAAAALGKRGPAIPALAVVAVGLAWLPTLGGYVYLRDAEITEPFDPAADHASLEPVRPQDIVAFNILSLAGLYERYRGPGDAPWTYAQLWDPVHEDLGLARKRLAAAAAGHDRLWLLLYKGTYSPDSAVLKAWTDARFHPAEGWWAGDRLIQGYVTKAPDERRTPGARFEGSGNGQEARLLGVDYSASVRPGGEIALDLVWSAPRAPRKDAKVFVHVLDRTGALLAQSDSFPVLDTRPPTSWRPGEVIRDRRGIFLPPDVAGPLTVRVGLYDPVSGARWLVKGDGDAYEIGPIEVQSPQ